MISAAQATGTETMPVAITIGGERFFADVTGALWHPGHQALLVADLHLEKGSSYARSGQLVPPFDTIATLSRLAAAATRWRARSIFVLGDAFHDAFAGERIADEAVAAIDALAAGRRLVWIKGNHDPAPPEQVPGDRADEVRLGDLVLRHEPRKALEGAEIAGHLHPVARVATRAQVVRRRCFVHDERRLLLPAFGAYAGGISVRLPVIAELFSMPSVHVLGERRVLSIARDRIV